MEDLLRQMNSLKYPKIQNMSKIAIRLDIFDVFKKKIILLRTNLSKIRGKNLIYLN